MLRAREVKMLQDQIQGQKLQIGLQLYLNLLLVYIEKKLAMPPKTVCKSIAASLSIWVKNILSVGCLNIYLAVTLVMTDYG